MARLLLGRNQRGIGMMETVLNGPTGGLLIGVGLAGFDPAVLSALVSRGGDLWVGGLMAYGGVSVSQSRSSRHRFID